MAEDNFYIINSWMIDELNLSGIELQVFAIIWSYSRGEKQMYIAGNAHLERMTKKSEPTIIATLKKLREKELIKKIPVVVNKVERNYYKAISQGTKESLGGYLKNLSGGTKEILAPNNKEIYKENNKENKRLSNDNQKVHDEEDELSFPSFYKLYPLKRSKPAAERAWKKLSAADKRMAIDKIQVYIADCVTNKRSFQYPATYLNQRTFEDDFGIKQKIAFYDPLDTDTDEQKRFKAWMRVTFPEIENTALPLSYDDYMRLIGENKEYVEQVTEALYTIDGEIWKYRKSDIAKVVQSIIS